MHRLTLALLAALALPSCGSARPSTASDEPPCVVGRISDGDSFHCADQRRVRLIGIDTPELGQGEPGRQAQEALRRLLPKGTTIRLERDVSPRDQYRRELAYVWVGPRLVNESMVREGWALLYTVPPNVKYAERLERAQKEARAARAGLWKSGGFACSPSAWRKRECADAGQPPR